MSNENAQAGVDYRVIKPFKDLMVKVAKRTRHLPEKRGVFLLPGANTHAVGYEFRGQGKHCWVATKEGLGNKAWIAAHLNHIGHEDPTGNFHFGGIGIDGFLMAANDNVAHGGIPVVAMDEVAVGVDNWFIGAEANAFAYSFERACVMHDCALGQGESPAYRYLMKAADPVRAAPSISVCTVGLVAPSDRYISGENVRPGDILLGFPSSGLHANGISPVINRVMGLEKGFMTPLNGRTVGQEALIPTRSYVGLVTALLDAELEIHACLPVTGDGIAKIGSDERYHYVVNHWISEDEIPPLFRFLMEIGVPKHEMVKTYNMGIGYIVILPPHELSYAKEIASNTQITGEEGPYTPVILGVVEEGPPGVYFKPWDLHLAPPGK